MLEGKVKFYNHRGEYGFIVHGEGSQKQDVFFRKRKSHVLTFVDDEPVWIQRPLLRKLKRGDVLVFELKHDPETGQPKAARWAFKDPMKKEEVPQTSVRIFA